MSEKYSAQNLMLDTIIGQINSGRTVDIAQLLKLYGDKNSDFGSRLLDSIIYRLRRERWVQVEEELDLDMMAAEGE